MRTPLLALGLLVPALTAPLAQAYQAGDLLVRVGAITVDPQESSDAIWVGALNSHVAGTEVALDGDTQLGLNLAYMLSDHLGIELLAASPFTHEVGVKGMPGAFAGLNGRLGELKQLPPTLSLVYYPLHGGSRLQPYAGAGLNYTWFFDDELSGEAEAKGFRGLDLEDSWGLAAQLGVDYRLNEKLLLNVQARYIDIDTRATTALAGREVRVDVAVDPWVYMAGLGYSF